MGITGPKHDSAQQQSRQPQLAVTQMPPITQTTSTHPQRMPHSSHTANTYTSHIQTRIAFTPTSRPTPNSYNDNYGDYPTTPKPSTQFRILFANINGISSQNIAQDCNQIGFIADSHSIDLLALAETNINWNNRTTNHQVRNIMKKYWPQSLMATSSMTTNRNVIYQPGGTLTILGNKWSGGANGSQDPSGMGRWNAFKITGRQSHHLHIITVYRIPNTTIQHAGPLTSYFQQWHHLRRNGYAKPNPRKQLWDDLSEYMHHQTHDHTAFIVLIDANESYTTKNSSLAQWARDHSLIDAHMHLHDISTDIPTHIRGTHRIDYILCSTSIIEYVQKAGILSYHVLSSTDHRSLYVDIDLQLFLRSHPPPSLTPAHRELHSRDPRGIKQYCQTLSQWMQKNDILTTLQEYENMQHNNQPLKQQHKDHLSMMENNFTSARLNAARQLNNRPRHPWSPKLRQAQLTVFYYKMWISQYLSLIHI